MVCLRKVKSCSLWRFLSVVVGDSFPLLILFSVPASSFVNYFYPFIYIAFVNGVISIHNIQLSVDIGHALAYLHYERNDDTSFCSKAPCVCNGEDGGRKIFWPMKSYTNNTCNLNGVGMLLKNPSDAIFLCQPFHCRNKATQMQFESHKNYGSTYITYEF